jgi:uncharacterized protein
MDIKMAIQNGDGEALGRLLAADGARANELIRWGQNNCRILTHPLHYVSDMIFDGTLPKGKELPLVNALLEAGADVDFRKGEKSETPLIGAASLGAEEVGIRLLDAGAKAHLRGDFGETALHWAALLGENRLAERLIEGADLELEDEQYHSTPLGWAVHGYLNPPAGNQGHQLEIVALLVAHGARVKPEWLVEVGADAEILDALRVKTP